MIIEQTTDLGKDALANPKKYNGFMGISIQQKFFSKKNMRYYFEWCSKYFNKFIIILMDDPDQYNFIVFKDLTPIDALKKTRIISDEIKRGYGRVIKGLNIANIEIVQFRDFINDPKYINILKHIKVFTKSNPLFKKDLYNLMEIGIGNKIIEMAKQKHLLKNQLIEVQRILSQYITAELASIIYFTEKGFTIEIDPTREFSTKKLIYEEKFPELYFNLKLARRGHIYVHPEGVVKSSY